ncbi:MAG: 50S ribosomal protein L4 [Candidatus Aminicenantes bacterium]|nr:50S ribosomal protein L4 [Candidatus Aminicenantes bacterium]
MPTVQVIDTSGKKIEEVKAPDEIFAVPLKEHLLYEAVINFRANQRQGTASTKTRGEVRGGGRKPWRQKGTGRARAGSNRSPIWRGGGTTFGPKPRDYSYSLPKKAKRSALKSALSMKLAEKQLLIVNALEIKEPKTKEAAALIKGLKVDSVLIVDRHDNKNLFLSARNIPKTKVVDVSQVNVYDVLNYNWLVLTKRAFDSLTEKLK